MSVLTIFLHHLFFKGLPTKKKILYKNANFFLRKFMKTDMWAYLGFQFCIRSGMGMLPNFSCHIRGMGGWSNTIQNVFIFWNIANFSDRYICSLTSSL